MSDEVLAKMTERYASGKTPWDQPLPPPEVIEFVDQATPGRALDFGCGYGRASFYLARAGWMVDGVDIVPQAIEGAKARAAAAGLAVSFHCHSITELSFLSGVYDYAIDVGCAHSLTAELWRLHHGELKRLLRPGATYMIYGRMRGAKEWGLDERDFLPLMQDGFTLERHEPGVTHMDDGESWRSAWYWFRRL